MRFQIQREALLKPLQMVVGAVEKKQTLPILSNIMVVVKGQFLLLTGTDLEVELVARMYLDAAAEEGAITVPARKFLDICRTLPEKTDISVVIEDQKALIKAGRGRYTLACLAADDFPRIEDGPGDTEFSLSTDSLHILIAHTAFAMAQQDVRYYLNGLLLRIGQGAIRSVATDGHRLATYALPLSSPNEPEGRVIIPRKAVLELSRLFAEEKDELGVLIGERHLRVVTPKYSFTTKLVDGKFPDYKQVLPSQAGRTAQLSVSGFKQLLARVAVLLADRNRGAGFEFTQGMLKVSATNADHDEVEEEMEIAYDGDTINIGFNISYLTEFLNIVKSKTVQMTFSDPNASVLFESVEDENVLYIVMPMRL